MAENWFIPFSDLFQAFFVPNFQDMDANGRKLVYSLFRPAKFKNLSSGFLHAKFLKHQRTIHKLH